MPVVAVILQPLEPRRLFDAVPLDVSTVITPLGPELRIVGTDGNDSILIARKGRDVYIANGDDWSMVWDGSANSIRIDGGDGNDRIVVKSNIWTSVAIYGGAGDDTLIGGTGDDRIYGGTGSDQINGGGGDDVIVTLGGTGRDRAFGSTGLDSYWLDSSTRDVVIDLSPEEAAAGALHRISNFTTPNSEPALTSAASGYADFSDSPLFSRFGPQASDVKQGQVGDCFLLSALASVAQVNPEILRQSMADLGDGTYVVQFARQDGDVFVRVDGNLPVDGNGDPAYAQLGAQKSSWVAIYEKAYAIYRLGNSDYASLDGGFPGEVYEDLGLPTQSFFSNGSTPQDLLDEVRSAESGNVAVTIGITPATTDPAVVPDHAYVLDSIQTDDSGNLTAVVLHSTWPTEGSGNVVLTPEQAQADIWFVSIGQV
jgi:hypothetical protein